MSFRYSVIRQLRCLALALPMVLGCGDSTGPTPLRPEIDLVVVVSLAGGGSHLAGLRQDGSGVVDLTPEATAARSPAWDRAGGRLIYSSGLAIRVLEAEGDRILVDTAVPAWAGYSVSPHWSPDGARAAFVAEGVIYTVQQGGGEPTPISPTSAWCWTPPTWSPDGTRLVTLCSQTFGGIKAPHIVAADGNTLDLLLPPDSAGQVEWGAPAWSPVRDEIAVPMTRPAGATQPASVVTVLRPDGSVLWELPCAGPPGTPAWAPDGRRLAFAVDNPSASSDSVVIHHLTSATRMVLALPAGTRASELAWSPRGDALAFTRAEGFSGTTVHVWRFGEAGGVTQLTPLLAESPAWRPR